MANQKEEIELDDDTAEEAPDAEQQRPKTTKLITQPYDLIVQSLVDQIDKKNLHLRPLSEKPSFQRRYVWDDIRASKLIESILLNVPIPQCFLSQNEEFELEVIDGQQRIYSIYRFVKNALSLRGLEILPELNGKRFHEIDVKEQRKIENFTLRCIYITNESDEDIKFMVFERLNLGTMTLNAQELRNCIYRSAFIDTINDMAEDERWLACLGRAEPDKRMIGEEMILRFCAFFLNGLNSYKTPQKSWLNNMAKSASKFDAAQIDKIKAAWGAAVDRTLIVFSPEEVFRRPKEKGKKSPVNKALMDLTLGTMVRLDEKAVRERRSEIRDLYFSMFADAEFMDLITRAVDHKSRTTRRFQIWNDKVGARLGIAVA